MLTTLRHMDDSARPDSAADSSAAAVPAPSAIAPSERKLPIRFTGSAGEYFRIWIVNLCLTLFTLGIFSAWAKVRKKRYFYSHTSIDGTPFQYLGQPLPILKGRLVAAVLFALWYAATHFFTALMPVALVLGVVLAPWVIVRAAAFNARYSAYRNMRFDFSGRYWGAVKVLYGWAVVTVLTLGIGFSWWQQRLKKFLVTHTHFGGIAGEFNATGGQFFKTYFIGGLLFTGAAMGIGMMVGMGSVLTRSADSVATGIVTAMLFYALYVMFYAYIQTRITNLVWNQSQLGPVTFQSTLRMRGLLKLYLTNALAILLSAGLLIPWATMRTLKYRADHLTVIAKDLNEFQGSTDSQVRAVGAEVGDLFDFDLSV